MWGAKQILFGAFALLAALLLLAGCPGSRPTTQDYSTIDLIQMFHAARQQRETGSLDLLSPLRYYYLPRGWYVFRVAGEDEPFGVAAAASRECRLRSQVVRPAERYSRRRPSAGGRALAGLQCEIARQVRWPTAAENRGLRR